MSMIHEITALAPRNKRSQRKGRGESSGRGKTSGRGNKAAHGGDVAWKPGHEGGQTPLFRRWPKRGFSNFNFERKFYIVNLSDLERFADGATVDAAALIELGVVRDTRQPLKILGNGAITKKLTVLAGWFSKSAQEKITQAGGTAQNPKGEAFEFPKPKKKFVKRDKPKKVVAEDNAPAATPAAPAQAAPSGGAAGEGAPGEGAPSAEQSQ